MPDVGFFPVFWKSLKKSALSFLLPSSFLPNAYLVCFEDRLNFLLRSCNGVTCWLLVYQANTSSNSLNQPYIHIYIFNLTTRPTYFHMISYRFGWTSLSFVRMFSVSPSAANLSDLLFFLFLLYSIGSLWSATDRLTSWSANWTQADRGINCQL